MYQQCLYIYDIVYLNGQVLTNLPLKERILKLREVVPDEIPGMNITENVDLRPSNRLNQQIKPQLTR